MFAPVADVPLKLMLSDRNVSVLFAVMVPLEKLRLVSEVVTARETSPPVEVIFPPFRVITPLELMLIAASDVNVPVLKPSASLNMVKGALRVMPVMVVAPSVAASANWIVPEVSESAPKSVLSNASVPEVVAPLTSAPAPEPSFNTVPFSTARSFNVPDVPAAIESPPVLANVISSDTSVTFVSPVIEVVAFTDNSLSFAKVRVTLLPTMSNPPVVANVPVVVISISPPLVTSASTAPTVKSPVWLIKIPPVPSAALAVNVPPIVVLIFVPVAPIAAFVAVAVNVRLPAVTADVLSVMLPVIVRISKALPITFTVPRPIPLASVMYAAPLVVVTVKLSTLRFNAFAALEPIPVESAIVNVVAVKSVVVSFPAASVMAPSASSVKVASVTRASFAAAKPNASE